jgi:excisionase family DNA binding protein
MQTTFPGTRQNEPERRLTPADLRERATITVDQAGAVLGLGRSGAYAAAGNGQIPTVRIGRRLVVPTAALLRMLGDEPRDAA